jgi:hypothetical protein
MIGNHLLQNDRFNTLTNLIDIQQTEVDIIRVGDESYQSAEFGQGLPGLTLQFGGFLTGIELIVASSKLTQIDGMQK